MTEKDLFRLVVKMALLAEFAVLLEREFFLYLLLVALSVMRDATTLRALHLGHVFLNLAHKNNINVIGSVRASLYGKRANSSTLSYKI